MTDTDRKRLAAILGMLGSNSAGERAAAALQAEAFRKKHGMTWDELIEGPPLWAQQAEDAMRAATVRISELEDEINEMAGELKRLRKGAPADQVVYVDRIVERTVPIYVEPSPWIDRLLTIAIYLGVPSGILTVAAAFGR